MTTVETEADTVNVLKDSIDSLFLIVMGIIVFLMQCGFALLEAGAVRSKNTVNILIKNMLDCLIGGLFYWAFGYGFAYGEAPEMISETNSTANEFIGTHQFFSIGLPHSKYPFWFFQFVFAATTATIVSGSIAERCTMLAYFLYSILLTGKYFVLFSARHDILVQIVSVNFKISHSTKTEFKMCFVSVLALAKLIFRLCVFLEHNQLL